jgi:hypothetical protein
MLEAVKEAETKRRHRLRELSERKERIQRERFDALKENDGRRREPSAEKAKPKEPKHHKRRSQ